MSFRHPHPRRYGVDLVDGEPDLSVVVLHKHSELLFGPGQHEPQFLVAAIAANRRSGSPSDIWRQLLAGR